MYVRHTNFSTKEFFCKMISRKNSNEENVSHYVEITESYSHSSYNDKNFVKPILSSTQCAQCGKVVEKAITIFTEKRIFFPSNQHKDETFANLLYKTPIGKCK